MSKLKPVHFDDAHPHAQKIFETLKQKVGMVPNIYAGVANSPVMLQALVEFSEKLKSGEFTPREVEAVALAIAQENKCEYCLSAHTEIGKMFGLTEDEILDLRLCKSEDKKLQVLTQLAKEIVTTKGYPNTETIERFFEVGYNKAALAELIGLVSLNIFTNYFNHIAETEIDFPVAKNLDVK